MTFWHAFQRVTRPLADDYANIPVAIVKNNAEKSPNKNNEYKQKFDRNIT